MGVYDAAIAAAQRMIAAKGAACLWTLPAAESTPDSSKPWIVTEGAAAAAVPVKIAFFPMSMRWMELLRLAPGSETVTGTLYGLMGVTAGFDPMQSINGVIERTIDGAKFGVLSVDPLAPNGEPILYTVRFKQ